MKRTEEPTPCTIRESMLSECARVEKVLGMPAIRERKKQTDERQPVAENSSKSFGLSSSQVPRSMPVARADVSRFSSLPKSS
jgi:hypothetical protein